jgi:ParB family chromosome partitioning protein
MTPEEEAAHGHALSEIAVSKIRANRLQPRVQFDAKSLEDLKQSIIENGVIQPITVRKVNGEYELIAGERRLRAAADLGFEKIPAFVIEVDTENRMLELALVENVQREDLNAIELAKAYERLQTEYGLTQESVAKKVGKDRATVANFIRLLKLPDPIQDGLRTGEITIGHAKALMALPSRGEQVRFWKKSVASGWNVRRIEEEVRKFLDGSARKTKRTEHRSSPVLASTEDRLRLLIGSKVRIRKSGKGGRIEIEYYSDDDLQRIVELLESVRG